MGSAVPGRLGQYGEDQALSGWVRGGKDGGGGVGVGRDVEGVTRGRVRTAEEVGRRNRNWLIGGVFSLVIGVLGAVFIVLYVRNNKPGGAGR